jgi:hypothetical protein
MEGDINVLPLNDLKEHEESAYCHCNPRVEVVGANLIIIHNAYDHREIIEEIERERECTTSD